MSSPKLLLPFYGSAEDIEKIVHYLRTKPTGATERDLVNALGSKFADPRKFDFYDLLNLFSRDGRIFRLTELGSSFLSSDQVKKQGIIRIAIRSFKPYEGVIDWAFHNEMLILDADQVRHHWVQKYKDDLDLTNKYRLDSAPMTFFAICAMAGLGTFLIGRRGAKSRLELNPPEVEALLSNALGPDGADKQVLEKDGYPNSRTVTTPSISNPENLVEPQPGALLQTKQAEFIFAIPVYGKVARLIWDQPTMNQKEWEKFKKVGDAMFLEDE
jgi:hypothetical protein